MKKRSKKGFTLIELIVVVAILAILAAIAIPNFMGMTKKAETATQVAAASELANAINIYNTMNPSSAIAGVDDAAITTLEGADLDVAFDGVPAADLATKVYARITIADGRATVTNRDYIA